MPEPRADSWSKVPPGHLVSPASRRGASARMIAGASGLALVAGIGAVLFAAFRPLPEPEDGPPAQAIPVVAFSGRSADFTLRERSLSDLSAGNLFAYKRKAWTPSGAGPDAEGTLGADTAPADSAAIKPEQTIPPDLKPAYDNLRLVAVFETHAKPGAMISFIEGPNPASSNVVRIGDELTDPVKGGAKWKVVAIDVPKHGVILEHTGRRVELLLFKPSAGLVIEPVKPPDPNNPVLVSITREQAIQKLREAKISEADIKRLIELLGPDAAVAAAPAVPPAAVKQPVTPDGVATAEALNKVLKPQDAKDAPPPGLEEVLKMMARRRAEVTGQTPPSNPQPEAKPPAEAPKP